MAETKKKMDAAREREEGHDWTLPPGMQLDQASAESSDEDEESVVAKAKLPKMKTQSQKNKAARLAAEVRSLSSFSSLALTIPKATRTCR